MWSEIPISKAAAREHLYTVSGTDTESDEIEKWIASEFEHPADEAISRVVEELRLSKSHWRSLTRFFGVQDLRTPANYFRMQQHWQQKVPGLLEKTMTDFRRRLASSTLDEFQFESEMTAHNPIPFPMRHSIEPSDEPGHKLLKVEITGGRNLWLWGLKQTLRKGGPLAALE